MLAGHPCAKPKTEEPSPVQRAELRQKIESVMREVAAQYDKELIANFGDDTPLLDSGLDSLDHAIVVARLQNELNLDPFGKLRQGSEFPKSFGEFVDAYCQSAGIEPGAGAAS
jgi:acyl carrier protein